MFYVNFEALQRVAFFRLLQAYLIKLKYKVNGSKLKVCSFLQLKISRLFIIYSFSCCVDPTRLLKHSQANT